MTTVRPVELAADAAAIARRSRAERSKLRRELGRLDAVCLLVAAIVVLDTLGAVARGGAQTLTWLAVVAALFFVPAGLVIAELGAAFPNQGGPYVWARLAFGRRAGSLVALAYFLETPVWVGGSLAITCVAVVDRLVLPLEGGWRVPVALAFVWATVALAVAPLRAGKRVPLAGAATQVGLLAFFTLTVVAYAADHGVHPPAAGDLAPSWAVFALVAPVLVYNFLGFELPSAAGEELVDPARDVPASIVRAGALTCALYAVPVLAIVLVVPAQRLTSLTGFIDALAEVFVVYGSWSGLVEGLAALAFVWILVANGLAWVMASSRTQAAAGLDGVGPPALGRVSARTGTPVVATLAVGLVATATTLAAFAVAGDDNGRYFSVALTLSISLLALANVVVFPTVVRLRRTRPDRPRPFRVPGGEAGVLAAAVLATGWSAVALAAALWPGLGTADPDAHLPDGFAGQRLAFTLAELVPLAVVAVAAVLLPRPRPAPPAVEAPFARAAKEFLGRGDAHFSIPGHKRNPALVGDQPALLDDMPHLCGVDDIRASRDLLGQAERLAAQAWGADRTWFSVSGSTMANQAMCLAVAAPGDRVVVARTSHRSVLAGLVLAGLEPVWVSPDVDPATGLALAVPPGRVERALGDHPDARAVILVEPSYLGLTSDVAAIARVAHQHGAALLCDQAWGAHFAFHPALPACAVAAGADLVVMSGHKTLTAFSQGAMLHGVDRGLVDLERLDASFELGWIGVATAGGRLSGATRTATTATRPGPPDARPKRLDAGQLATLGAVAGEWLAAVLAVGPTDREAAEDGVRRAYQSAGLAPPERVVWLGSPQAGAVAVALLTGLDADVTAPDPRWDRVRDELEGQGQPTAPGRPGRPVRPLLGPLLWAEVRARLLQQMAPGLWERAWSATAGALLGRLPERIWYLQLEAGGPIDARLGWRATERLAGLRRVTRSAGWWWPFERLAVLTDRPAALHRDERDELHCPDGPALAYPDGSAVHTWHGRPVPGELIARLPGLGADDITAEPNLELRRIMTESYGLHRYLRDAGGRVVGQDTYGRLWRLDRPGAEPLVMVEVVNSTPEPDGSHATYWLRVPPDIRSAHAAVAWTFRLNEGTYRPLAET